MVCGHFFHSTQYRSPTKRPRCRCGCSGVGGHIQLKIMIILMKPPETKHVTMAGYRVPEDNKRRSHLKVVDPFTPDIMKKMQFSWLHINFPPPSRSTHAPLHRMAHQLANSGAKSDEKADRGQKISMQCETMKKNDSKVIMWPVDSICPCTQKARSTCFPIKGCPKSGNTLPTSANG